MSKWLPEWCMPGVSFRKGGKLHHIRAVVDDRAVVRIARGAEWDYEVVPHTWFNDQETAITYQPTPQTRRCRR